MFQSHVKKNKKDEWLTPPTILQALGPLDLDPCAPVKRPWSIAAQHLTIADNGLQFDWGSKFVFLNPPYSQLDIWMGKMADHNNGLALIFARTDRNTFHSFVFGIADSVLFIKQRLHFFDIMGNQAEHNGGAPSVLIAYGEQASERLAASQIGGYHQLMNRIAVVVVGIGKSWRMVVRTALVNLNNEACLDQLYAQVVIDFPERLQTNKNYRAKIRQTLQRHFIRRRPGVWAV